MGESSDGKMKEEVYQNVGGMNTKADPYSMTSTEFLSLSNFDFQSPGALSQRWGTTLYQAQNFSGPITALYEYVKLDGTSGIVTGVSGSIWFGATTGQALGFSSPQGTTVATIIAFPNLQWNVTHHDFRPATGQGGVFYQDNPNQILGAPLGAGVSFFIPSHIFGSNKFDFVTMQDHLFMADGNIFIKFN